MIIPSYFLCAICAWLSQKNRKSDVKPQILEAILYVNIYVSTFLYVFSSKNESCVFVSCIYKRQNVIIFKVRKKVHPKKKVEINFKKSVTKEVLFYKRQRNKKTIFFLYHMTKIFYKWSKVEKNNTKKLIFVS